MRWIACSAAADRRIQDSHPVILLSRVDCRLGAFAAGSATCGRPTESTTTRRDTATAARLMREHAVRRLPVIDAGQVAGVVSLGDLALEDDPGWPVP